MQSNEIQRIFDRVMKQRGGIVIDEDVLFTWCSSTKNIYDRKLSDIKTKFNPKMPDVHFYFTRDISLNAVAFIENNHWFIGMNQGTLFVIYSLFFRMLSDSKILNHIGDSAIEDDESSMNSYWNSNALDLLIKGVFLKPPKDPVRLAYAKLLSEIAIDFLFFHEYTHLANGHVSFLKNINNVSYISETDDGGNNDSPIDEYKLIRQTLEYDADSGAVGQGWATIWGRLNNLSNLSKDYRCFYKNIEDALFAWEFSIFNLFLMFDTQAINLNKIYSTFHPQLTIRYLMVSSTMYEYLKKYTSEDFNNEITRRVTDKVINESIKSSEFITGFKAKEEGIVMNLKQIISGEGFVQQQNYGEKIREQWKTIRPLLLPLAKGASLAP